MVKQCFTSEADTPCALAGCTDDLPCISGFGVIQALDDPVEVLLIAASRVLLNKPVALNELGEVGRTLRRFSRVIV